MALCVNFRRKSLNMCEAISMHLFFCHFKFTVDNLSFLGKKPFNLDIQDKCPI